jgi:hypothetical protein
MVRSCKRIGKLHDVTSGTFSEREVSYVEVMFNTTQKDAMTQATEHAEQKARAAKQFASDLAKHQAALNAARNQETQ